MLNKIRKYKIYRAILKTKNNVLMRSEKLDFDLLGRSLSCNPFLPRKYYYKLNNKFIDVLVINDINKINNYELIAIDTTHKNDLSIISNIRRYTKSLIIHKDIFISKYQILESLVYGADFIILDCNILDSNSLESLFNFAVHLGLEVIIHFDNKIDANFIFNLDTKFYTTNDKNLHNYILNDRLLINLKHK